MFGLDLCFVISVQALKSEDRRKILMDVADALEENENMILAENSADIEAAEEAGYEKPLISRLALKPGRVLIFHPFFLLLPMKIRLLRKVFFFFLVLQIKLLANSVRKLADMEEPIGRILKRSEVGFILESCFFFFIYHFI